MNFFFCGFLSVTGDVLLWICGSGTNKIFDRIGPKPMADPVAVMLACHSTVYDTSVYEALSSRFCYLDESKVHL